MIEPKEMLVSLKGSFQNFRRASPAILYGSPQGDSLTLILDVLLLLDRHHFLGSPSALHQ